MIVAHMPNIYLSYLFYFGILIKKVAQMLCVCVFVCVCACVHIDSTYNYSILAQLQKRLLKYGMLLGISISLCMNRCMSL